MGIEKPTVSTAGVGCNCTASNFGLLSLAEVESRTQGSRQRPRTQKRSEAKDRPSEDGPSRGEGHNALVFSKKKVIAQKKKSEVFREYQTYFQKKVIKNFPRDLWLAPTRRKKNGLDLGPFLTNQKMVLSRTGHFCKVLEPKAGRFRGFAGFEAKDFKLCTQRVHL